MVFEDTVAETEGAEDEENVEDGGAKDSRPASL